MDARICEAISRHEILEVRYHGGTRWLEPHIYGYNENTRQEILSGYQIAGYSLSDSPLGWRTFVVDDLHDLKNLHMNFKPRTGYNPEAPGFTVIFCEL